MATRLRDPRPPTKEKPCCMARGCTAERDPAYMMCAAHWFALRDRVRQDVWDQLHAGSSYEAPSKGLRAAMDAAIEVAASRRVVHCKKDRYDVFVGRPSPFGNPFSHLPNTNAKFRVASRDEAISAFEKWLTTQPALVAKIKSELRGKVLGCFCAPQRCHGDVLARIANEPATPSRAPLSASVTPSAEPGVRQGGTGGGLLGRVRGILAKRAGANLTPIRSIGEPSPGLQKRPAPTKKLPIAPLHERSDYDPRAHGALCDECPAKDRHVVPPTPASKEGPPIAAIVGMEPGWEEIRQGRAFVGRSGKKLEKQLAKHGIDRKSLHVTNAALCLPEKEDDRLKAYKCCLPRLQKELAALPVQTPVITLGAPAFRSAFGKKLAVTKVRGFVWHDKNGRKFFPTIHPAFVLRDAVQAPLWNLDWERIARCLKNDGEIKLLEPPEYFVPRSLSDLKACLDLFKDDTWVSCDVETSREPATVCELQCIGISNGKDTVVVPWYSDFAPQLKKFFSTRWAIGHNIFAFDAIVLNRHGVPLPWIEDTLIAHHAFASHFRQGMDHLMSVYADVPPWKVLYGLSGPDEKGQAKKALGEEDLHKYNAYDAYYEAHLWNLMARDVEANQALYEHDRHNARMYMRMTETGVQVDLERRKEISDALKAKIDRMYAEMQKLVGYEFSPTKPRDLRKILFDEFGAPVLELTDKDKLPSTSKRSLQEYALKFDTNYGQFSSCLIKWRMCRKVLATHVDGLHIEYDGRVRAKWKSFGTPTGRPSVAAPNLNNQKRADKRFVGEPEYRVRELFVPRKGHRFVAFDLAQIEPRMSAYLSGDPEFIKAVESGDIHTYIARILFGQDEPRLKDSKTAKSEGAFMRQVAKSAGLGLSYCAGAETLHATLHSDGFDTPMSRVVVMLETLHRVFHVYFEFIERQTQFCRKHGYIVAGFASGRKRWLGHAPEPQKIANTPCQGGAADVMNYRMAELDACFDNGKRYPKRPQMIAQVYDSVIVEVREDLAARVEEDMKTVMGRPWTINGYEVVLPIDLKSGYRWSEV